MLLKNLLQVARTFINLIRTDSNAFINIFYITKIEYTKIVTYILIKVIEKNLRQFRYKSSLRRYVYN